ncbi:hypothetical protein D5273_11485 [Enterorhabdus caecimuris]|nr:hypothetical protein [Adlercreutzia caecimuris]
MSGIISKKEVKSYGLSNSSSFRDKLMASMELEASKEKCPELILVKNIAVIATAIQNKNVAINAQIHFAKNHEERFFDFRRELTPKYPLPYLPT